MVPGRRDGLVEALCAGVAVTEREWLELEEDGTMGRGRCGLDMNKCRNGNRNKR